jgi:hypothetical protein
MQNEPNFPKSQMLVTQVLTTNCNEKLTMDTWSKQTQTKPTCSELVEPILPATPFGGLVRSSVSDHLFDKAKSCKYHWLFIERSK